MDLQNTMESHLMMLSINVQSFSKIFWRCSYDSEDIQLHWFVTYRNVLKNWYSFRWPKTSKNIMEKLGANLKTRYSPVQSDGIWHHFITIWSTVCLQITCQKTHRNISNEVKCSIGINIHGRHNGFSNWWKDRDQVVSWAVKTLALNWNVCEKVVV